MSLSSATVSPDRVVLSFDATELAALDLVLRAPPPPPLTRSNHDLAEMLAQGVHLSRGLSFEELDRMEEALVTHGVKTSLGDQEDFLFEKLGVDRPRMAIAQSLKEIQNAVKPMDFRNMLAAISVDLWPRRVWSISTIWEPLMETLSASRPSKEIQSLWQNLVDFGITRKVWSQPGRRPLWHTLVDTGPYDMGEGLPVWKAQLKEAFHFTPSDHTSEADAARMMGKLLRLGAYDMADILAKKNLNLHAVSLEFAHAASIDAQGDVANWEWLLGHVDPMAPDLYAEEAIWRVLAKTGGTGKAGSNAARAWGRLNDPTGLEEIEREEYFLALETAETLPKLKKVLTSRPDWASLISSDGTPAVWAAVQNNTEILEQLPVKQVNWSARNAQGQDLWFAFVSSRTKKVSVIQRLSSHCLPSLTPEGDGWLCEYPSLVSSNSSVPLLLLKSHAVLCWTGTSEKQDRLADRLFSTPWKADTGFSPSNLLMLNAQDTLVGKGFAEMSPKLKAWWAIWSQGFPRLEKEEERLSLNVIFPEGVAGVHLPPIAPARQDGRPPCLWQEGHDEWNTRAQVRLREWKALSHPAEIESSPPRRSRARP